MTASAISLRCLQHIMYDVYYILAIESTAIWRAGPPGGLGLFFAAAFGLPGGSFYAFGVAFQEFGGGITNGIVDEFADVNAACRCQVDHVLHVWRGPETADGALAFAGIFFCFRHF